MLPQLLVAHSLYVVGLYAGKEWVLALDVGVPWLLIRVLALGGLGFAAWEVRYGRLFASRAIEVRLSCSPLPVEDSSLNFWSIVVCRRDGFAVCAFTTCVVARCAGCPVTHKVRFYLHFNRGTSEDRGNHDSVLRLHCRVIISTQYSTVWPKVLTGGSSVRPTCSPVENRC